MSGFDTAYLKSPIGTIEVKSSEKGIVSLYFIDDVEINYTMFAANDCIVQLEQYFAGELESFNLALDLHGTEFQKSVWLELLKIPFGETNTYLNIAKKLGADDFLTKPLDFNMLKDKLKELV